MVQAKASLGSHSPTLLCHFTSADITPTQPYSLSGEPIPSIYLGTYTH